MHPSFCAPFTQLLGDKEQRKTICETRIRPRKFDVVVTSYECVLKEKATLMKISWNYLLIDEAHRIKVCHCAQFCPFL